MAQQFQSEDATFVTPGAYAKATFQSGASGLGVIGVLAIVGESEGGPDFTLEDDLKVDSLYGPDQEGEVAAKYLSGPLVDAFRLAASPSNDVRVIGAPNRIAVIKTNVSTKASAAIDKWDTTEYADIADKSYGKKGNLISITITADQSEVLPTTGAFTYIPAAGTVAYGIRVNGAAEVGGTLSADTSPATLVSTLAALSGVNATGGANLAVHPASGNVALTVVSGNAVQIDTTVALGAIPPIGSTFAIANGSVIEGAADANVGAYVVTGSSANQILATKLSDAGKPAAVPGTITAPANVGSTALSGTPANDLAAYGAVTITLDAADPLDGRGKSLEIASLTAGTDLLTRTAFVLGTITAVSWVSTAASPQLLSSATEYAVNLTAARQLDNRSEELIAGGEIAMRIGYDGTTATLTIDDDTLTTTVVGGSGANLSLSLEDYPTIADLATYINSQTGYVCSAGTAVLGQQSPLAIDDVTAAGICTTHGVPTGRLKMDAFRLFQTISEESSLIQLQDADGDVVQAAGGLPAPAATVYLTGGAKGSTTAAQVTAAYAALQKVPLNFVVPLFSRDAADDFADGLTESGSTYEIEAVNLGLRTHVINMSKIKMSRSRQGFASIQTTFEAAREAAANLASFRVSMCFQDIRALSSDGTVKQFQPWAAAVLAAGCQAAGVYQPIVRKGTNIAGALQAAGDFDDGDQTDVENALLAGLLPLRRDESGVVYWVSDQTTYGKDTNEFLNSIQAVYVSDLLNADLRLALEQAFVGESLANVTATTIVSKVQSKMNEYKTRKWIAASDDAPAGYKNLRVTISGAQARVRLEAKLATGLYFILVDTLFSLVQQSAEG